MNESKDLLSFYSEHLYLGNLFSELFKLSLLLHSFMGKFSDNSRRKWTDSDLLSISKSDIHVYGNSLLESNKWSTALHPPFAVHVNSHFLHCQIYQ